MYFVTYVAENTSHALTEILMCARMSNFLDTVLYAKATGQKEMIAKVFAICLLRKEILRKYLIGAQINTSVTMPCILNHVCYIVHDI